MKNLGKLLSLILGLSLATQAVHGAALKTSLEAAKNSLSSLADTAAGKALIKNKDYVAVAAWLYYMYRVHKYIGHMVTARDGLVPYMPYAAPPIAIYALLSGKSKVSPLDVLPIAIVGIGGAYWLTHAITNGELVHAARNNHMNDVAKHLKGFGSITPNQQALISALRETHDPAIVRQLIKAGAAKSAEGHKALLQAHPQIAEQVFTGRQNVLIAQLSQPATATSKKTRTLITQRLPNSVAAHIASFDTGITVTKPMSAATAQALAAADKLKPDVANLDEILDAALKELDE